MWLDLLVSTTKRTYNLSIWNLIFNIHFVIYEIIFFMCPLSIYLLINYVLLYFQHHEIYNYLLKQYSQMIKHC
jgi:hypothetical protein